MKTLIVYHSEHHMNTEKVARVLAEVLNAELVKAIDLELDSVKEYDLIGFGSGVFWGKHHENILRVADILPHFSGKKTFVFSTSGADAISRGYHDVLKSKLALKGFEIVGEWNCLGFDTAISAEGINQGRPNDDDLRRVREFALSLLRGVLQTKE